MSVMKSGTNHTNDNSPNVWENNIQNTSSGYILQMLTNMYLGVKKHFAKYIQMTWKIVMGYQSTWFVLENSWLLLNTFV